jgi:methyl-accepting chemotaxis protein
MRCYIKRYMRRSGQAAGSPLTSALNLTLDDLESPLREVHVASNEISAAADQIAAGSQSMAEGASEQASSLEEINASLQEFDTLFRQSTVEAKDVQRLAEAARTTADDSVSQMQRLNEAMDAIRARVRTSRSCAAC